MATTEEMNMKEKVVMWIAWHLPRKLVYWCAIRVIADATVESSTPAPEFLAMDALKVW